MSVDDGLCFGDIDGDGDLDIIGYNQTYPTRTLNVYRNDLPAKNWLNVRTVGLAGNSGAAGAKISVYAAGTNQLLWYEQVAQYDFQVATSYYGRAQTERHFGLGSRSTVDVVVEFPQSGHVTRINGVAANQTINVLESGASQPALAGDYNQSAKVDAGDYVLWRKTAGTSVTPSTGADGSGNGLVDQADYNVWRTHFGMSSPASGTSAASESSSVQALDSELNVHKPVPNVSERDMALAAFEEECLARQNAVSHARRGARHLI
jgi:hypothetical protein